MKNNSSALRKITMAASAVVMTVGLVSSFNFEAQASGASNTGPASTVDCGGIGTGSKKICLSENTNSCTERACE